MGLQQIDEMTVFWIYFVSVLDVTAAVLVQMFGIKFIAMHRVFHLVSQWLSDGDQQKGQRGTTVSSQNAEELFFVCLYMIVFVCLFFDVVFFCPFVASSETVIWFHIICASLYWLFCFGLIGINFLIWICSHLMECPIWDMTRTDGSNSTEN